MADPKSKEALLEPEKLVRQWLAGIRIIHIAHTRLSADYALRGRLLGLAVTIVAAITGSTVFAAADGSSNPWVLYTVSALSMIAAVLAAAQTFLELPALAARHAAAAQEYGLLRREFESALAGEPGDLPALLEKVRADWSAIEAKYPLVSQRRYRQAQLEVSGQKGRRAGGPPDA